MFRFVRSAVTPTALPLLLTLCCSFSLWGQCEPLLWEANDPGEGSAFGTTVSISGDVAVVGAPFHDGARASSGAVYVYRRAGSDWSFETKLTASDGAFQDRLGSSVAVSGDTIVAGAPGRSVGGVFGHGSAYVFRYDGSAWTEEATLVAADGTFFDAFGTHVAIEDDVAIVAALYGDAPGATDSGAAYAFTRTGTTWSEQQKLIASDSEFADRFGNCMALHDDALLITALFDNEVAPSAGAAYVFRFVAGSWIEEQKLTSPTSGQDHWFGNSGDLHGDVAVVGAYFGGEVVVFRHVAGVWEIEQEITPPPTEFTSTALAVEGNTLFSGAAGAGASGPIEPVHRFEFDGTTWSFVESLAGTPGPTYVGFGDALDIESGDLVVGARLADGSAPESGLTYFFGDRSSCAPFVRGDCNRDGANDISDPVFLLAFLVAGGATPVCSDACDGNDDGAMDIADAITMLAATFIPSTPPLAAPTTCGPDPTGDTLDCAAIPATCP